LPQILAELEGGEGAGYNSTGEGRGLTLLKRGFNGVGEFKRVDSEIANKPNPPL
jgi:hypothetical protein